MRPRRFLLGAATAVLVSCLIVTISIDAVAAPRAAHGQTRVVLRPPKLPKKQPAKKGTAWAKVLDQIAPDGQVSTKTALQAFAIAIAPLPGVHPPRGPPGTGIDGGEAVRWVIAHWADLTPKQQAVVQKVLTGTPVPQTSGPGRSLPMKGTNVWPVVTEMLARYDAPLGHLPIPVTVEYLGGVPQGAPAATEALAEPVNSSGGWSGPAATCQVQITPAGAKASGPDFEMVIAHELFHCYQAVWMGDLSAFYALAHTWVLEGSATWAGYNVAPDPPSDENNHWPTYLESPSKPLFQREHDAVGFFGQVAQWGVDLWPLFPKFFQTSGDVARYQMLVDATGGALLDAWGPGYWMNSRLAEAWRVEGKAVPPAQPISGYLAAPQAMVVADHTTQNVAAKPYTVAMYGGTPTADVTEVQIGGHARLADGAPNGETFDTTQLSDTYLCTKADHDCSCPDDTDSAGNDLPASIQKVEGFLRLGLTGASDGATGTLTGLSLKDFCKKRNHKKATTACDVLTIKDIDTITGLHITSVKDNGDACVFTDPSAPVNSVLQSFASVISKAFTGSGASIDTGAGVIVRLQTLPAGPEPQVQDYFGEIPEGLCDAPQLIDGVNGATAICQGVENIVVVSNGKFVHIVYLASADSATHEQGAALGQAADDRL